MLRLSDMPHVLQELSDEETNLRNSDIDSDSDLSDGNIENEFFTDESELEGQESNDEFMITDQDFILGKDLETIWCTTEVKGAYKTPQKNIVKILPGPKPKAREVKNEVDAFLQFFDRDMLELIVKFTNMYIDNISHDYNRERDCRRTNYTELLALLGILYLIGLRKENHANVQEIWTSDGTGVMVVRAAMSYKRFLFLLRCMRFDNPATRSDRCRIDKLAAIRTILDPFVKNCIDSYNTSELVTIDEMLHPFRGRCSFVQCIPSKPAKYGIKMFALCDARTFFCNNLEVYCGKQPPGPYEVSNKPEDIVKRLVVPIEKSNKNLTTDNWYTSIPLVEDMLAKDITMIGTLKKNNAAIPPSFLPNKNRVVGTTEFGFSDNKTLVSFVPKVNKAVILVSSMHDSKSIDPDTGKPDIILDYNMTKGGVDTCEKMCAAYSVSLVTRRWPQAIFYVLLNIASINSRVLLSFIKPQEAPRRRIFQKNLAMGLLNEHLATRAQIRSLPKDISVYLEQYKRPEEQCMYFKLCTTPNEPPTKKRGNCVLCGRQKNSSASMKCDKCSSFMCKEHSKKTIICLRCCEEETTN
ncbi:uncharacterized protein LOC120350035 [Nilaparvata lugens]|uniref:uncharacterized protein LOC120349717 n=1 Tax=Nilaparvata lugens TaxID=108931 RepID=UPI00193CDD83|nr:uncharacterized protein LOC120349717 [Nilaparvata lugens]XP_039277968.1 uncharacterized protein LOC120350035 [Nilaparvata lugens]